MKIFNIMLSRELGGIQQAYIDYNEALLLDNHQLFNISDLRADINKKLSPDHCLINVAPWCFLSPIYLRFLINKHQPDFIICHGTRAINFTHKAVRGREESTKIIGVSHNYSYKALKKCDYVLTVTRDLRNHLIEKGIDKARLFDLPNMLRIGKEYKEKNYRNPLIIGGMGRFVPKKGFAFLLKATKIILDYGHDIRLILGGDGPEKEQLKELSEGLGIANNIEFIGWVDDVSKFFEQIDIFCLPSVSEAFGIALLESMENSTPIIAFDSGGPRNIIDNKKDGLIVPQDAKELADSIITLMHDPELAKKMARTAHAKLKEKYDLNVVSKQLTQILKQIKTH